MHVSIYDALIVFSDHTAEIALSLTQTLEDEHKQIQEETKDFGDSWVAMDVRNLIIEDRCGGLQKSLKTVVQHHNAKFVPPRKGRITQADIERAKEYPIEHLYHGKLRKGTGKSKYVGLCPFHDERTGSFHIFKDNHYKCFGCGAYGSAIDFHMNTNGKSFVNSVKELSGNSPVDN